MKMSVSKSTLVLYSSVIIALLGFFVSSANAIRCHQCNSHLNEDCVALQLTVPRAKRDEQFLTECQGEGAGHAFCRKTIYTLEATGESRIVRGCGWIQEPFHTSSLNRSDRCINADNEGFVQTICTCFSDGCNAAPFTLSALNVQTLGFALVASYIFARSVNY